MLNMRNEDFRTTVFSGELVCLFLDTFFQPSMLKLDNPLKIYWFVPENKEDPPLNCFSYL